jgi:hypothetical protein
MVEWLKVKAQNSSPSTKKKKKRKENYMSFSICTVLLKYSQAQRKYLLKIKAAYIHILSR